MVSILSQNDQDPSKLVRPEVYNRMAIYRDNPERRKKARECSARWRQNNPEKTLQNWKQFNEDYARKTRENLMLVNIGLSHESKQTLVNRE